MRILSIIGLLLVGSVAAAEDDKETKRAQDYLKAGTKRFEGGKYKEALAAFKRGLEHKPLPELRYQLGRCHAALGDTESAAREYRAYLAAWPEAAERAEIERYLRDAPAAPPPAAPAAGSPNAAKGPPAKAPAPPSEPEKCTDGKLVTIGTNGHCCWREQMWSDDKNVCIGIPRCPAGWVARGDDCVKRAGGDEGGGRRDGERDEPPPPAAKGCPPGKVTVRGGHCCWPGQFWADEDEICIGDPRCPRGYTARGRDCLKRASDTEE